MVPRQLVHRSVSSRCSSFTSGRSPHWTATRTSPHVAERRGHAPPMSTFGYVRCDRGSTYLCWYRQGDARLDCRHTASQISESCMSELFLTCTLILNNHDWDELDTEHQLGLRLRNKLLLLYFGSGSCDDCRAFTRLLRRFWTRLTDPAHVERAAPLALVYVSHDPSADCQRAYMRHSMPSEWLSLHHGDPLASELARRFEVRALPSVVVLQPSGEEVTRAGAEEIRRLGEAAFASWREAAEVLDRGFLLAEDFEEVETPFRSLSHHVRRLFYKTEKEKHGPDDFLRDGAV